MIESEIRQAIVAETKSWLKTKWHHEGRIKGAGVDCGMMILEVYHNCGLIPKINPDHYSPDFMMHNDEEWFLNLMRQYGNEIPETSKFLPGDCVVFRNGRLYSHGAIIIDYPLLIHASRYDGCVCYGNINQFPLLKKRKKFFRYKFESESEIF